MKLIENLKLLWKNRKVVKQAAEVIKGVSKVKPGQRTTEFWGKTVCQVLTILATLKPELEINPETGLAIVAGLEGLYTIARSIIKAYSKS